MAWQRLSQCVDKKTPKGNWQRRELIGRARLVGWHACVMVHDSPPGTAPGRSASQAAHPTMAALRPPTISSYPRRRHQVRTPSAQQILHAAIGAGGSDTTPRSTRSPRHEAVCRAPKLGALNHQAPCNLIHIEPHAHPNIRRSTSQRRMNTLPP